MQDIRFNPTDNSVDAMQASAQTPHQPPELQKEKTKKKFFSKKIFLIIIIVFLSAALVALFKLSGMGGSSAGSTDLSRKADPSASSYYSVFLTDGQIYFGEIAENNTYEMVLSNAYRMQPNGQTYSLIKLVDEAYGPTNQIFINRSQILFYEQLRKDSRVVELINKQE